jgi:hypothetical protein
MNFKFLTSSNIFDFPIEEYGRAKIDTCLKSLTEGLNVESLADWKIIFFGVFTEANSIKVLKRGITIAKSKTKEIFIHIPIPSNKTVEWGINPSKYGKTVPVSEKKFIIIPIDFRQFNSMEDLIVDSVCKGIHVALTNGITVEGKKIRLKSD